MAPPAPAAPSAKDDAARLCRLYVGVRVGTSLSVEVDQVVPLPKRQQWVVTGRIRGVRPPLQFVCRLSQTPQRWQLEQLELLQLQQARRPSGSPAT